MRVFVAGATGVIGRQLVPLLVEGGHVVAGMTCSPGHAGSLRSLGAEPIVGDVFEADALRAALVAFGPDVVVQQLTDLPDDRARLVEFAAATSRIRREGSRNLLAAARAAGAWGFAAQSVAWSLPGDGGAAVAELEQAVLDAAGVVVRYGQFYGPGTYFAGQELPPPPRIHVAEAARRTVPLLSAPSGIVLIVEEA